MTGRVSRFLAIALRGRRVLARLAIYGLALGCTLATVMPAPAHASSTVEVILHSGRDPKSVDQSALRAIFSMRMRQWPDGTATKVFVLPDDNPLHDQFCREQLGMYPYVLRTLWDRLVFTGTGLAPTVVRNEEEMRRRVLSTPGAIGYQRSLAGSQSVDRDERGKVP